MNKQRHSATLALPTSRFGSSLMNHSLCPSMMTVALCSFECARCWYGGAHSQNWYCSLPFHFILMIHCTALHRTVLPKRHLPCPTHLCVVAQAVVLGVRATRSRRSTFRFAVLDGGLLYLTVCKHIQHPQPPNPHNHNLRFSPQRAKAKTKLPSLNAFPHLHYQHYQHHQHY